MFLADAGDSAACTAPVADAVGDGEKRPADSRVTNSTPEDEDDAARERLRLQKQTGSEEEVADVALSEPPPDSFSSSSSSSSSQSPARADPEKTEPDAMDTAEAGSARRSETLRDGTSLTAAEVENPSASDTDERAGQSEDDDEDEDDPGAEALLQSAPCQHDEMSNLSHGDESSSGFLGSPGDPDSHMLAMDLGPSCRPRSDSLLTETDDSLPFDSLKCDGEKLKRRGSPGRSRVKQVTRCVLWVRV